VYGGVDETDYLSFREMFFNRWLDDPRMAIVVVEDVVENLRQLVAFDMDITKSRCASYSNSAGRDGSGSSEGTF
jgi:hypothetical protein